MSEIAVIGGGRGGRPETEYKIFHRDACCSFDPFGFTAASVAALCFQARPNLETVVIGWNLGRVGIIVIGEELSPDEQHLIEYNLPVTLVAHFATAKTVEQFEQPAQPVLEN